MSRYGRSVLRIARIERRPKMKRWIILAAVAMSVALALSNTAGAGPLVQWDQPNDGAAALWLTSTGDAQSFTPALSAVDTVQLCFDPESAADVSVSILDSNGNALGTSSTFSVPESPAPWPASVLPRIVGTFTFSPAVALTAGDAYTIQTAATSGHAYMWTAPFDPTDPVGSGSGLWYREGVSSIDPANATAYVASPAC
jgi:hypothetical protein